MPDITSVRPRRLLAVLAAGLLFAAVSCGDDNDGDAGTTKDPVATFEVAGVETYKIALATPELVEHARQLLAGEDVAAIPNGKVVRNDPSVNEPWSWHIDPATLEFADMTTEVCDGLPSYVEDDTVTSEYYCPWLTKLIKIDE